MIDHALLPYLYYVACCALICFQFALIFGAPWGRITQGGQHEGPLPLTGRVAAFVSVFILIGMGLAVGSAAGLWPHWPIWASWVAVAVQGASTIANWITPSRPERIIWGPITLSMLALALWIVLSA